MKGLKEEINKIKRQEIKIKKFMAINTIHVLNIKALYYFIQEKKGRGLFIKAKWKNS